MLSKKLTIGVLCGGSSSERAVSKRSGRAAYRAIKNLGFRVLLVDPRNSKQMEKRLQRIDIAFLTLHGAGGEDGSIQRYLEARKIPFTGSNARSSFLAFDKILTKRVLEQARIQTPDYCVLTRANAQRQIRNFGGACFVKPPKEGSSIGVFSVEQIECAAESITRSLKQYPVLLAERTISGREFTVGVLGHQALPVVELKPKGGFYDYHSKYTKGMTEYIVPAKIPVRLRARMQALALRTHRSLGLRDFSRIDFKVDLKGKPYVLEANSIPGFTELSLLPKAARAAGISFEELCYRLISMAYQRARKNKGNGQR